MPHHTRRSLTLVLWPPGSLDHQGEIQRPGRPLILREAIQRLDTTDRPRRASQRLDQR
jgi:hypothetical protein